MRSILSLFLFVGLALGYSTSYYGWVPQKEFVYHFESQVLTGIPEIRNQYAGVKLSSKVIVQSYPDYSLRVKFEDPKFLTINEELPVVNGKPFVPTKAYEEVPEIIRKYLVSPFEVHVKRGVVETLFVEKDEPVVVTNVKKSLLSQIQMDLSASKEFEVQKLNHVVLPQLEQGQEEMRNISIFSTMETTITGQCETEYTLHPLPLYQARELEEQWRVEKTKIIQSLPSYSGKITEEKMLKESREAESTCFDQTYYQITKTTNFDNCRETPLFNAVSGLKSKCDPSTSSCDNEMSRLSSTKYVVCGNPEQFTIRKALTEDLVSNNPVAWSSEDKMKSISTVTLDLIKVETSGFQPLKKPTSPKRLNTLLFEYPEKKTFSHKSISEYFNGQTQGTQNKFQTLTGFYPIHPMPELTTSPELLFPSSIPMPELIHQVKELMSKIVKETYETPESCTSSSDLAGSIMSIAKALRTLSVEQLKEVRAEVTRHMETYKPKTRTTAKYVLLDIISMVGTNPSVVLIKELVESEEIPRENAAQLLQSTLKNIKTPTPELFNMIFSLVKTVKSKSTQLYAVSCVGLSDVLYRSCINPTTMVSEFPVRIYGNFCNPETTFIKEEWIPYLETQLETSVKKPTEEKVILIHSLGKLGHYKVLTPLAKVIEGKFTSKPSIRSMAVYNLKRVALEYPTKVRPVLLSLIDNPAEQPEVRIAAVSVLPFSSPSSAEYQKIALRTWFEPSKQVVSFIYSTMKSLSETKVPELLGSKPLVRGILPMIKPVLTGVQYSHNVQVSNVVEYLRVVISNGITLVNSQDSLVPKKLTLSHSILNSSIRIPVFKFSVYTEGMDRVLEKFLYLTDLMGKSSQSVRSELQKLQEKLNIKRRETPTPEAHLSFQFMGIERLFSFNSEYYFETVQKISEELRSNPRIFTEGVKFESTRAENLFDVQIIGPTSSGFPMEYQSSLTVVTSLKSHMKANNTRSVETESVVPSSLKMELIPIVNAKAQTTYGVISPFTKQYIGTGVVLSAHSSLPMETLISLNHEGQVSLKLKTPEKIIKEVELLHLNVKPFTFKKSLTLLEPISSSAGHKILLSDNTLKKTELNPGKVLGLDTPVKVTTDRHVLDLASVYQKLMKSPSIMTVLETSIMPSTVRYTSVQIRYNPISSPTKELQTRFTLAHSIKKSPSETVTVLYPKSNTHTDEIRKMCVENHQNEYEVTECIDKQERMIKSTSDVSEKARKYCENEKLTTRSEDELEQCLMSSKLCDQSEIVCMKKTYSPKVCIEKKIACQVRQRNLLKSKYVLKKLQSGKSVSVSVEGSLNSHYDQSTTRVFITVGGQRKNLDYKGLVEVDVYTPSPEPYVVESKIHLRLPEVKTKWNKEQLLRDDLKTTGKISIFYGLKSQMEKSKIEIETLMEKTEGQKESVRRSPEYKRCSEEESEGRSLSPICEMVRHQAASIDKFVLKVKLPKTTVSIPGSHLIKDILRTAYLFNIKERTFQSSALTGLKENEFVIEGLVSRQSKEAQLKITNHVSELNIENIRLPSGLTNVLPLSLRNGIIYRLVQKVTRQHSPASCRVEPLSVSTFDNKTYPFTINDCEHLLVKDCSSTYPIAVTVRGTTSQRRVKLISGLTIVEIKSETGSIFNGIYVNGEKKIVREGEIYTKKSPVTGKTILQIQAYLDGVIVVREFEQMVEVAFDGERIEVVAPQLLRGRSCGLCGDLNGESTADLLTPKMCVFENPRIAAYTYMIKESCQEIPSQDKPEFEKEVRECTKKTVLPTPLEEVTSRNIKTKSGPKGILRKHLVEYRANGNEICISKITIPVCEMGSVPVIGEMSSTPFTCLKTTSPRSKHLKSLVESHEVVMELQRYPTTYTRMIEQASGCKGPSEGTFSSSSVSGSHYRPHHGRHQPRVYDY